MPPGEGTIITRNVGYVQTPFLNIQLALISRGKIISLARTYTHEKE